MEYQSNYYRQKYGSGGKTTRANSDDTQYQYQSNYYKNKMQNQTTQPEQYQYQSNYYKQKAAQQQKQAAPKVASQNTEKSISETVKELTTPAQNTTAQNKTVQTTNENKVAEGRKILEAGGSTADTIFKGINTANGQLSNLKASMLETVAEKVFGQKANKWAVLDESMNQQDKDTFLSLVATDPVEAKDYLQNYLNTTYKEDTDPTKGLKEALTIKEGDNALEKGLKRAGGVATSLVGNLGSINYIKDVANQLVENKVTGENNTTPQNTAGGMAIQANEAGSDLATQGMSGTPKFLANTGLSIANNLAQILTLNSAAPLMMAIQSGTQGAYMAGEKGEGATQQAALGGLYGAAEYLGEKVGYKGFEKIAKEAGLKSGVTNLIKSLAAQAATEFSEESATEAMNILSEMLVLGDKSEQAQYYNEYMQEHPGSKAGAALNTILMEAARVGAAGLTGAISGVATGGVATLAGRNETSNLGKEVQTDAEKVINTGLSMGEGSESYTRAAELKSQIENGKTPKNLELGALVQTIMNESMQNSSQSSEQKTQVVDQSTETTQNTNIQQANKGIQMPVFDQPTNTAQQQNVQQLEAKQAVRDALNGKTQERTQSANLMQKMQELRQYNETNSGEDWQNRNDVPEWNGNKTPEAWADTAQQAQPKEQSFTQTVTQNAKTKAQKVVEQRAQTELRQNSLVQQTFDKHPITHGYSMGTNQDATSILTAEETKNILTRDFQTFADRTMATSKERAFARQIANGEYSAEDIGPSMRKDIVTTLAGIQQGINEANRNGIQGRKQQMTANRQMQYRVLLSPISKDDFENLDMKEASAVELNWLTPERVIKRVFGTELGNKIIDQVIKPIHYNESAKIGFLNDLYRQAAKFNLSHVESMLVHLIGDSTAIGENGEQVTIEKIKNKAVSASDLPDTMNIKQKEYVLKHANEADANKVQAALTFYQQTYKSIHPLINEIRVMAGLQPIGYVEGYFPHFNEDDIVTKTLKDLGMEGTDGLPTSIAGITAWFRPNSRWVANFQTRYGIETTYDANLGFQSYMNSVADMLYHVDDIMNLRQLDAALRGQFNTAEDRNTVDSILTKTRMKQNLSEEDQQQIDKIIKGEYATREANSKYATFAAWLTEYTNKIANKQLLTDRSKEADFGRKAYNIANKLEAAFGRNSVVGNITSALNNTVTLPKILATTSTTDQVNALKGIISGQFKKMGIANDSEFLTGKKGIDYLSQTTSQKLAKKIMSVTFDPVEEAVSDFAFYTKYTEAIRKGQTQAEATITANDYAAYMMARRTKGSRPLKFESKKISNKLLTMFQTEITNDFESLIYDVPQAYKDAKGSTAKKEVTAKIRGGVVKYCIYAHALNLILNQIAGIMPAPDPIEWIKEFFEDLKFSDWNENTISQNVENIGTAAKNLGENVLGNVPGASTALALIGAGNGRVPLPNYDLSKIGKGIDALAFKSAEEMPNKYEYAAQNLTKGLVWPAAMTFLPFGGAQLKKTVEGLSTVAQGGSYSVDAQGNKKTRFNIENPTIFDYIQAGFFGQYALQEAKDYVNGGLKMQSASQTELYQNAKEEGLSNEFSQVSQQLDGSRTQADLYKVLNSSALPEDTKTSMWNLYAQTYGWTTGYQDYKEKGAAETITMEEADAAAQSKGWGEAFETVKTAMGDNKTQKQLFRTLRYSEYDEETRKGIWALYQKMYGWQMTYREYKGKGEL